MTAPIKLTDNEKRLLNAFRTTDRRGRRAIMEYAANEAVKWPWAGKVRPLFPVRDDEGSK